MGITIQNPPPKNPNPDPDEVELSGKQMSFLEHLEELRVRLLHSIYSIIVTTGICFWYRDAIYAYLAKPLTDTLRALHLPPQLVYTNPVDPFNLYIKLSIMGGIFLASPYILISALAVYFSRTLPQRKEIHLALRPADQRTVHVGRFFRLQAGFAQGISISCWSLPRSFSPW